MKSTGVIALILISFALKAQPGKISGLIIDKTTQEALIGVNVSVEGSGAGAVSDMDGKYEIAGLAPGTYKLNFSYIGYANKSVSEVEVKANTLVTLNVTLDQSASELHEVEIVDFKKTNTETAVLLELRQASQIASGVSSQQISKTLDRDAGQVVRRIPGVSILGNFVNIRGLNQRYNTVLLNNAIAPSVEADVKSFSFDIIPSSQLDRILVLKSPAADAMADFAGGIVKIYTKSLPDSNYWSIGYNTSFRTGTSFQPFYNQKNGALFYVGGDKTHELPKGFPSDVRQVSDMDQLVSVSRSLNNDWSVRKMAAIPDQRLTITKGSRIRANNCLIGNITSLNYTLAKQTSDVSRADYGAYNTTENHPSPLYNYNDKVYTDAVRLGVLHNWSFKFDKKHYLEIDNLANINSSSQFTDRNGRNFANPRIVHDRSYYQLYRGVISSQVSGKHILTEDVNSIDWMASYSHAYRKEPDYKRYITNVDTISKVENIYVPNQVSPDFLGRFFSSLKEDLYSAAISYSHKIGFKKQRKIIPILSAGTYVEYKNRDFNARNIGYISGNPSTLDHTLLTNGIENLFQPQNINTTTGIIMSETTSNSDSYKSSNLLSSVYANLEMNADKRFRLVAGLRYEYNLQQLDSYGENGKVKVKNPRSSFLPSINMSYNFTDKMLVRLAYGITNNKPEFREIAPFAFYDFNNGYVFKGNPDLTYCTIHNADVKWEYYPNPGEVINIGFFYKRFNNPIEVVNVVGADRTFSFQNAKKADTYGAEVEVKKNFRRSGLKFFHDLGINLNAAYIYSRVKLYDKGSIGQSDNRPLQGQAPYTVNVGIFYNNKEKGIQWNVLYNVTGKRIVFVGFNDYPDVYQLPKHSIDLNASYNFRKGVELSLGVTDLLNQKTTLIQDGNGDGKLNTKTDQVMQSYKTGTSISIGVKYTFK